MLMAAVICMFGATIALSVLDCFLKNNKAISFSLQLFSLATLFCGTIALAQYKNKLSLFAIILAVSVLPQILTLFNFKEILQNRKNIKKTQKNEENSQNFDEKPSFFEKFEQSNGKTLSALGILLTSILLSVCGLVLGLETVYLYLLALAIAAFATFLTLIIKKNINLFDLLSYIFVYLAAALAISQILTVLIYSFDLKNILYCLGMLAFATYSICFVTLKKSNHTNLIYLLSMAILLSTLLI